MTQRKPGQGARPDYAGLLLRAESRTAMYRQAIDRERIARLKKDPPPGKKVCATCGRLLPTEDFEPMAAAADGLRWQCRRCRAMASIVRRRDASDDRL